MTPRPAVKLPTPPVDETATPFERFEKLLARLVRVPKHEIEATDVNSNDRKEIDRNPKPSR